MVNFLFYFHSKKTKFLEMKNQYIKSNSNRHETINKNQLTSRLKVIEFLKEQLYPTGKFNFNLILKIKNLLNLDSSISLFQISNEDLFPTRRILNQRIREIRQKLMSHLKQGNVSLNSSS
jgi:hypothetical protein